MVDIDKCLETLKEGKCIPEKDLRTLCDKVLYLLVTKTMIG
jgi:hypothetical protein